MSDKSGAEIAVELVGSVISLLVRSWLVMLFIGSLHTQYAEVPAVGFHAAFLLVLIAGWATYPHSER
ncbi:hypothetical protein ACIF6L_26540 [Kitasatospora sp. NPDC086009]|uniref:hypothetical protein n=1 Tax=unclassified Kitasatospora TaxID=2633591 RepID=UPI0037C52060